MKDLYIEKRGSKLGIRDGLFQITYFNEKGLRQEEQLAPAEVSSVWLQDGATITTHAMLAALECNVKIVLSDSLGRPVATMQPLKPGTTSMIKKAQALASLSNIGLERARLWTVKKLENMAKVLISLKGRRDRPKQNLLNDNIQEILEQKSRLALLKLDGILDPASVIRGIEGVAGRAFFHALSMIIPNRYRFEGRSKRPAKDAFNAALNYAYGVLYIKTEAAVVSAGFDPYLGFMHRDGHGMKSMVYDFIEPFRANVAETVFRLFSRKKITLATDIQGLDEGNVSLTKSGRKTVVMALNQLFNEKIVRFNGTNMKYFQMMKRMARQEAQLISTHFEESKTERHVHLDHV